MRAGLLRPGRVEVWRYGQGSSPPAQKLALSGRGRGRLLDQHATPGERGPAVMGDDHGVEDLAGGMVVHDRRRRPLHESIAVPLGGTRGVTNPVCTATLEF